MTELILGNERNDDVYEKQISLMQSKSIRLSRIKMVNSFEVRMMCVNYKQDTIKIEEKHDILTQLSLCVLSFTFLCKNVG